jgi:predicted NBD/HSP70 family sugar kinase
LSGTAAVVVGALDVGGTHVTAGRVELATARVDAASRTRVMLPPRANRSELIALLVGAAAALAPPEIRRFAVAVPGPFDYPRGISRITHKLEALRGVDLRRELAGGLGLPDERAVTFLNDADAFLLGEWWAGAARGQARPVGITLGSGLGSAFLAEGRIVEEGEGVPPGGNLYLLPFGGEPVERSISRQGLLARYGGEGVDVEELAGRARAGDGQARRAFQELAADLGEFLAPWLVSFGATCLVVGGAIAQAWDLLGPTLEETVARCAPLATVVAARNVDDAPLLGAAWHAARLAKEVG